MLATTSIRSSVGRYVQPGKPPVPNLNADVRVVQQLLNEAHLRQRVPRVPLKVDGLIGPKTCGAICEFQQAVFGWKDGVVEPNKQTWKKLTGGAVGPAPVTPPVPGGGGGAATSTLAERAVVVALQEDGVREQPLGSNGGPRVMEYLRSTGLTTPNLWCMAFVYWCFQQAAAQTGQPNTLHRTASCTNLYSWASQHQRLVTQPARGDIFLVRGGAGGRTHCHTGIVVGVQGGSLSTIEGNTNNDGSSNGIGVFRRTRAAGALDFVRV